MILAKPVKTYLMESIKAAIEGISQIKQVKYGQGIPIDKDTAVYPWTCFFDDSETKVIRGRIVMKSFDLVIQTTVKAGISTVDEQMDLIDSELEKTLTLKDADIKEYAMKIDPSEAKKFVTDEVTGILQSVFKLQYSHALENPYELVKAS